jgi:hypothetical protein
MFLERITVPGDISGALALEFPHGGAASDASVESGHGLIALLSLASEGDMKYGDSASSANRIRFLTAAGADPNRTLGLRLAHSRTVLFPEDPEQHRILAREAEKRGGADGILLRDPALIATVTVADCMPIWIRDRDSGAFGVLHSGWKGTGILAEAVAILRRRFESRPDSISVILGPAIGSCCYEVPAERAEAFAAEFGEEAAYRMHGSWRIDLRAANIALARSLGLGAVLSVEACTSCDHRLGSYRRQGPDMFTRMLAACGRFPLAHPIS